MNYEAHYSKLIDRAKARSLAGYSELHHIIPKCLGGNNSKSNVVRLTAPEHYVAHQLLVKMHPGHKGLIWSAMSMSNGFIGRMAGRSKNKCYQWLRIRFAEVVRRSWVGRKHTEESRKKMSLTRTGMKRTPHTEETKLKMSLAAKGKPKSAAHCSAMSIAKTGKPNPHSEGWNQNIRTALLKASSEGKFSYPRTEGYKNIMSVASTQAWARRKAREELSRQN